MVVIAPGRDPGGSVLRPLHRHGPPHRAVLGGAADHAPPACQCPSPQLRDEPAQGQRRRRQPGGDRRDRRCGRSPTPPRPTYAVEDYVHFVAVQAESALRHVATTHPYDDADRHGTSLRGSTDLVADELAHEVAQRVVIAGRRDHRGPDQPPRLRPRDRPGHAARQQADAVVAAAPASSVDGAVGMVEMALARLDARRSSSSTTNARPPWCPTCWLCCAATERRGLLHRLPHSNPGARPASGRKPQRHAPLRLDPAVHTRRSPGARPAQR